MQKEFAKKAVEALEHNKEVIGITAGGSWLTNELDDFSDLDLIIVTRDKISDDKEQMLAYAEKLGKLLNGFTGEHVGDPRVLICLYDDPLLHVDLKFLTVEEFHKRVEDPVILHDTGDTLRKIIEETEARFPIPTFQWMEDRFWTWVHYLLVKIGRGEYFEAFDGLGFMREMVLGPLLHIKNGNFPRGVRKMETLIGKDDLELLKLTISEYNKESLIISLEHIIFLYENLRNELFTEDIILRTETERSVMDYFKKIKRGYSMSDSPKIKINEDGCYIVTGLSKMTEIERLVNEQGSAVDWKHGKEFEVKEKMALCRCGHSKNKPYCDGTHIKIGFKGEMKADREERDTREAVYGGNGITMTDDESLCAGYEFCDRFGSVWRMMKISENHRIKGRINKQVSLCPTGRLQYIMPGSEEPEEIHYEPKIDAVKDGPLLALGNIPVEAPDGFVYEVRNRQALCRCGQSGNMPFCDGTHWEKGFKSE